VIDEAVNRPPPDVGGVIFGNGRKFGDRALDHRRFNRGGSTRLDHRPPPATTEINAEFFEDSRGPEVGGDNFPDCESLEWFAHDAP
jgi:hypothetical protein